jgi:type II secretory pathway predicted ATPase ExeA
MRLQFLVEHHGAGLITGQVGSGKSTAARSFTAGLNPNLFKVMYLHWTPGSTLDLLRQVALDLDLEPAHYCGDLVRQISQAIVRLNQSKKQHPILICDEAQLLGHPSLEQLPLLLNFDMDSSRYLTLLLVGEPLLRRTLSRRCTNQCASASRWLRNRWLHFYRRKQPLYDARADGLRNLWTVIARSSSLSHCLFRSAALSPVIPNF